MQRVVPDQGTPRPGVSSLPVWTSSLVAVQPEIDRPLPVPFAHALDADRVLT